MDAQQALADLTEISSQIQAAVVFDGQGKVAASTLADDARAQELADGALRLLEHAEELQAGERRVSQIEVATFEGSVFVVSDGKTRIAATTPPEPTVGLVFYDLKSAARSITPAPEPPKRKPAARKPAAQKPPAAKKAAPKKPASEKKPAPRKKKTDAP